MRAALAAWSGACCAHPVGGVPGGAARQAGSAEPSLGAVSSCMRIAEAATERARHTLASERPILPTMASILFVGYVLVLRSLCLLTMVSYLYTVSSGCVLCAMPSA